MKTNILAFLISLIVALIISPLVVFLSKKLKASQTILEYVKEHQSKNSTPTLGRIIFIVSSFVALCFFNA
ncbi:MAG: phospho-N-acetylmuramoyl-pentapeptide-transferase, partial [Clostridia bacterium]|nr:phospho-N-acetylmuramoyl-pentapeptide-transferase [Clostridia bacterium]